MTQILVFLRIPLPQAQFKITTSSNEFIIVTYCLVCIWISFYCYTFVLLSLWTYFQFYYVCGLTVCIWLHLRFIFLFYILDLSSWCVVSSDCWLPLEVETVNLCVSRYSVSLDLFIAIVLPLESLLKCSANKLKLEGISFGWLWCMTL